MKTKRTLVIACVAAVGMTAACSQVSDTTRLRGTIIDGEDFEEVNVVVDKYDIDTLVPVVNSKFKVDLPADPTEIAFVSAGYYKAYFILDGTRLNMTLGEEFTVTSKSKESLQNKYNGFEDSIAEMTEEFQTQLTELLRAEDLSSNEYSTYYEEVLDAAATAIVNYVKKTIRENGDNAIAGIAIHKLDGVVEDGDLVYLLGSLSEEMLESRIVAPFRQEVGARILTAEGMPFRDFTVEDSDGRTVSLSDYVGKGKYVLLDFWASWCQPCRDEVPNIKEAYNKFHSRGLDVVSVAVVDDPIDSKAAAKELGMNWNLIINAGQLPLEVYGFSAIPQIMLIGPDGTILKKGLRGEEIIREIEKHIK